MSTATPPATAPAAISQVETLTLTVGPQVNPGEIITTIITKPDQTTDSVVVTVNPDGSIPNGTYTATQLGAYSGVASVVQVDTGSVILLAASSPSASFNVTEGQIPRTVALSFSP